MATIYGGTGADTLYGDNDSNNNDIIYGLAGADRIYGLTGNDILYGGGGVDFVEGGTGNDTVYGGTDAGGGDDTLYGGADFDFVSYVGVAGGVTVNLATGTASGEGGDILGGFEGVIGGSGADNITGDTAANILLGEAGADLVSGGVGADTLYGGLDGDTLYGGIDDDLLFGGDGVDRLQGDSGRDTLAGGAGADSIFGGTGSDTADYSASGAAVNVNINDAAVESGGDAAGDTLSGIENLIGSASGDTLTGNNVGNVIDGGAGSDTITGNLGSDSIIGGDGNDVINAGPDTIAGGGPVSPTNEFFDWTTGGLGDGDGIPNTLTRDTGTMSVTANFTPGNSSAYFVETEAIYSPEAFLSDNSSARLERPGAGEITELSFGFQAEAGSGMTNEVSNVRFRISDIDTSGFIDRVRIFAYDELGNIVPVSITTTTGEISIVGDTATAVPGNGNTEPDLPDGSILITIPGPVSQIVIQYDDALDAFQAIHVSDVHFTTIPATVDNVDDDTVSGGLGNDFIEAGLGDDLLYGGADNDTLLGEAGNDSLSGDAGNDSLVGGDGNDTMDGGDNADILYGDGGNDSIAGGAGIDTLYGGAGNDNVDGGVGDDFLYGGGGTDNVLGGDDRDLISMSYTAALNDVLGSETVDGGGGGTDNDTLRVDITGFGWTRIDLTFDPLNSENGTITFFGAGPTFPVIGTLTFTDIENLVIVCFTAGTRIMTARGPVLVEALQPGDMVLTRDNGVQPLRWVGQRQLSAAELQARPELQPVRIAQGALGAAGPDRSMLVSPQHRVLIEGARAEMYFGESEVLVPAKHLTSLAEVTRALPAEGVTYVHILFDQHEIVQSDGIWTESFQPAERTLSALDQAARDEVLELFPVLAVNADAFPAARLSLKAHEAKVLVGR
jgi:Ca2+-binding RTX toxin-like protein